MMLSEQNFPLWRKIRFRPDDLHSVIISRTGRTTKQACLAKRQILAILLRPDTARSAETFYEILLVILDGILCLNIDVYETSNCWRNYGENASYARFTPNSRGT